MPPFATNWERDKQLGSKITSSESGICRAGHSTLE